MLLVDVKKDIKASHFGWSDGAEADAEKLRILHALIMTRTSARAKDCRGSWIDFGLEAFIIRG